MSRPDPLADTPAYKCLVRAVAHSTIYTGYLKLSRVTFYILQRLLSSTPPQPSPLQSDGVLCGSSLKRVRCPLIGLSLVSLLPDSEEGGYSSESQSSQWSDEWSECE